MKTTLCIVDMQSKFRTHTQVIEGVLKEIRLAKRRGSPIVVLEYHPGGDTIEPIHKELHPYSNLVAFAIKDRDDGSMEFLEAAEERGFTNRRVRVCGVNGCFCVHDTVYGLLDAGLIVEAANHAIGCQCERSHTYSRVKMR